MTQQLVLIDAAVLESIDQRLARMEAQLAPLAPLADAAQWLTVAEAAERYGVSRSTICRWVREGSWLAEGSGAARRVRPVPE